MLRSLQSGAIPFKEYIMRKRRLVLALTVVGIFSAAVEFVALDRWYEAGDQSVHEEQRKQALQRQCFEQYAQ